MIEVKIDERKFVMFIKRDGFSDDRVSFKLLTLYKIIIQSFYLHLSKTTTYLVQFSLVWFGLVQFMTIQNMPVKLPFLFFAISDTHLFSSFLNCNLNKIDINNQQIQFIIASTVCCWRQSQLLTQSYLKYKLSNQPHPQPTYIPSQYFATNYMILFLLNLLESSLQHPLPEKFTFPNSEDIYLNFIMHTIYHNTFSAAMLHLQYNQNCHQGTLFTFKKNEVVRIITSIKIYLDYIYFEMEQQPRKKTLFQHVHYILFEIKLSLKLTLALQFTLMLLFAITSFSLGMYVFFETPNISYYLYDYGALPNCLSNLGKNTTCTAHIIVQKKLTPPIDVYYELDNFISNTKDYIFSKSYPQLHGNHIDIDSKQAKKCMPYMTNKEMGVTKSWAGKALNPGDLASPCGLQAKLFFMDQFQLFNSASSIAISQGSSTRQFKRSRNSQDSQWIDPQSSKFQIWMTTSVNKTVSKLYGVINQVVEAGNYTVKIKNMMDYRIFQTQKNLRLTKSNNQFGNNKLLGTLFIIAGASLLCICISRFIYDVNQIKKND